MWARIRRNTSCNRPLHIRSPKNPPGKKPNPPSPLLNSWPSFWERIASTVHLLNKRAISRSPKHQSIWEAFNYRKKKIYLISGINWRKSSLWWCRLIIRSSSTPMRKSNVNSANFRMQAKKYQAKWRPFVRTISSYWPDCKISVIDP